MARILFRGKPINTCGLPPPVGMVAPEFTLRRADFSPLALSDLAQERIVLFILPSVNAIHCGDDLCEFERLMADYPEESTAALCVTMDLPFTLASFQEKANIKRVTLLSEFNYSLFGDTYGVRMVDGPYPGLLAKSLFIIDKDRKITHGEQVYELTDRPDFSALSLGREVDHELP